MPRSGCGGSGLLALAVLADAVGSAGAGAACADTPGWAGPWGITCAQYTTGDASFWGITTMPHLCQDRGHRAAQSFLGATWNYPEENCCACGKGIASLDTRLWDDCDPRWETIKRGCPGYRAWETASDYYRKQSSPARSLGPGNPCFNLGEEACGQDERCGWDKTGGGWQGTDAADTHQCNLRDDTKDYAEGHRLQQASADPQKHAKCLDGSPPLYFLKRGFGDGANKWYVHHEGGGWCIGEEGCGLRGKGAGESQVLVEGGPKVYTLLGSTEMLVDSMILDQAGGGAGYFSSDPEVNPSMYNWNHVLMKYCDGASFSGNRDKPLTTKNGTTIWFRGKAVLEAIQDDLLAKHGLATATDLVVSGCSAGGNSPRDRSHLGCILLRIGRC